MKKLLSRLIAISLLVTVASIFAIAQTDSSPTVPSSTPPNAIPSRSADLPAIPEILKNPVLLGQILAKLEAETARANSAVNQIAELEKSRDEWKAIADKEKERADQIEIANLSRREEAASLRASVGFLRQSVDDYKKEVDDLRRDLRSARGKHKWYFAGGAAGGLAACFATRQ